MRLLFWWRCSRAVKGRRSTGISSTCISREWGVHGWQCREDYQLIPSFASHFSHWHGRAPFPRASFSPVAAIALSTILFSGATAAQSVGLPPPAIIFTIQSDTARAIRAVSDVVRDSGYTVIARRTGFLTTARRTLPQEGTESLMVRISASAIPAGSGTSVVMLWGDEVGSSTHQGSYLVFDDSQVLTGGMGWTALNGIRTAVKREVSRGVSRNAPGTQ